MLEDIKLNDLLKIISVLKDNNENKMDYTNPKIKIVILQRGWVIVGRFYQRGHNCWVENGYVIRKWGTTKGLGQLALEGKQEETILDEIPTTEFHELTIVAAINCNEHKWEELC